MQAGDLPGPAPSSRRPCDDCRRTGRTTLGLCLVCNGTGLRRATLREQRTDGWDEYVEAPIAEAVVPQLSAGHDPASEYRRLSASIARIQRTLDQKAGRDVVLPFQWEMERARYEREGSYAELRRALSVLHDRSPHVYAVIRRVYTIRLVDLSSRDRLMEEMGVQFLAREMTDIRVPPWLEQADQERRNDTIESLAARGMTAGAIARRLKLPKDKVRRVLRRSQQRQQRPQNVVQSVASGSPREGFEVPAP